MNTASTQERLLRAFYAFMLPIVRLLLRSGVGFKEFSEMSRMAFVEVASQDFGLRGRPTNISRVAAMTGIGRKQVKRLRHARSPYGNHLQVEQGPLTDVLQRWHADKSYLDEHGRPKALRMHGRRSFASLVKTSASDLPPGAVKVELIRCGSVEEDASGRLHALRRAVIPTGLEDKVVLGLTLGLRGLASTIAFNTTGKHLGAAGRIQRCCVSDTISEQSISAMHPLLRGHLETFADKMTDVLAQPKRAPRGRRIGVGIFYYEDD
jgi:Family of unknown function (DUF6502)